MPGVVEELRDGPIGCPGGGILSSGDFIVSLDMSLCSEALDVDLSRPDGPLRSL